jgi:cell division control protein 7
MDLNEIKHYMYSLLTSLKHLSSKGIVHRDVKPSNFLYDPETRTGLLIDFGLSEVEMDHNWRPINHGDNELIKKII